MRLCQRSKEHGHLKLVSVYFIFFQEIGCSSVLILGGVTHMRGMLEDVQILCSSTTEILRSLEIDNI